MNEQLQERTGFSIAGLPMLGAMLLLMLLSCLGLLTRAPILMSVSGLLLATALLGCKGLVQITSNEAMVLQLFGRYAGTLRHDGLRWTNPFYTRIRRSLRVRNFESGKLKVNDAHGNPIEIASIVVWQVVDTARATFGVDDYASFVQIQSEAALRQIAQSYAYDSHGDDSAPALRGNDETITDGLCQQIQARVQEAGVKVIEARISHLAYAPEIATAMLQRQQAEAIVAARSRIVEGAVGMVGMALEALRSQGVVELDEERKATMVSHLLVVLCGDRAAQPVINTGSLYS
ncbi:SPFH domain-containing protein [Frateuria aurantia]